MRKYTFIFLLLVSGAFSSLYLSAQSVKNTSCKIANTSFKEGEELNYLISYNWFVVFAEVGNVKFTIEKQRIYGQDAYHFVGDGKSNGWWDNFFEVRDRYEVWVRQDNLRPIYFQRNNKEGNFRQQESYTYKSDSLIYRKSKVNNHGVRYDTLKINRCTYDVMSVLLYTRNLDFTGAKVGDQYPVSIALDNEAYDIYFRFKGIENIKVKDLGTFECKKFTVLLVEGTIFHEGEDMLLWVTNDKNHIPVYVESPILIGNIKGRITSIKGNRYPLTSKK